MAVEAQQNEKENDAEDGAEGDTNDFAVYAWPDAWPFRRGLRWLGVVVLPVGFVIMVVVVIGLGVLWKFWQGWVAFPRCVLARFLLVRVGGDESGRDDERR